MTDADLGIIGGGFWGMTAAQMAVERGYDVTIWDADHDLGASQVAAGIIQLWWYESVTTSKMLPDWWDESYPEWAVDWLDGRVNLLDTGELYTSFQGKDGEFRDDCYLIEECSQLLTLQPVTEKEVGRISPTPQEDGPDWAVHFTGDREPPATCDNLLVAAGAWTDDLLRASDLPTVGVEPLRGRALLVEPHDYDEDPPRAYDETKDALPESIPDSTPHTIYPRPYSHLTLRPYRDKYRFGDTTEQDLGGNEAELNRAMKKAGEIVGDYDLAEVQDGVRPVCDTITVEQIRSDLPSGVVATGGHRVGLLLAPICARRALRLLNLW